MLVRAEVVEVLRDSMEADEVMFSLTLPRAFSLEARDRSVARAAAVLPIDRVVLLLRKRSDADYHRLVNGFGIWAETTRAALDAPVQPYAPSDEPTPYEAELAPLSTLDDLVEFLR